MFQKEKWDLDKDGDKNGGNSRLGIIMLMLTLDDFQWQQAALPTAQGDRPGSLRHLCARYPGSQAEDPQQNSPANIQPALLTDLNAKFGREATMDSLSGATQRPVTLKINPHNPQLLNNHIYGLDNVRERARLTSLGCHMLETG